MVSSPSTLTPIAVTRAHVQPSIPASSWRPLRWSHLGHLLRGFTPSKTASPASPRLSRRRRIWHLRRQSRARWNAILAFLWRPLESTRPFGHLPISSGLASLTASPGSARPHRLRRIQHLHRWSKTRWNTISLVLWRLLWRPPKSKSAHPFRHSSISFPASLTASLASARLRRVHQHRR